MDIITILQDLFKISKKAGMDTTELEVNDVQVLSSHVLKAMVYSNPLCLQLCDYLSHLCQE